MALTAAPPLPATYPKQKSPGWATFWNFIWPGAGHLYADVATGFGITFAILTGVFVLIGFTGIGLVISIPAWLIMAVWSMSDVNGKVKARNKALGYLHTDDVIAARSQRPPQ